MTKYGQKDVKVCVDNSMNLFKVAFNRLQPPIRYGILELSAEEMTKAWWVFFAINPERIFPGLEKVDYNEKIDKEFEIHDVKIGEMQELTKVIITQMRNKVPSPSIIESTVKCGFSKIPEYRYVKGRVDPKITYASNNPDTLDNLLKWMESITKIDAKKIPKIKETAFYVAKSKDGLVPPALSYDYSLLAWLCVFNIFSIEIIMGDVSSHTDLYKLVQKDNEIFNVIKKIVPTSRR